MKKTLAILLSLVMIVSMLPLAVVADAAEGGTYYLTGTISGWGPDENFKFSQTSNTTHEEYSISKIYLTVDDRLKAIKTSKSGQSIAEWYPDGVENDLTVDKDGWYTIYFRPNGDGGDDWVYSPYDDETDIGGALSHGGHMFFFSYLYADPDRLVGDADTDCEITILDANTIQRWLSGLDNDFFSVERADADEDGEITVLDAAALQRWLAKLDSWKNIGWPIGFSGHQPYDVAAPRHPSDNHYDNCIITVNDFDGSQRIIDAPDGETLTVELALTLPEGFKLTAADMCVYFNADVQGDSLILSGGFGEECFPVLGDDVTTDFYVRHFLYANYSDASGAVFGDGDVLMSTSFNISGDASIIYITVPKLAVIDSDNNREVWIDGGEDISGVEGFGFKTVLKIGGVEVEEPEIPYVPEEPTEAPEEPTEAPEEPTEAPEEPTEAPEEPTEAPEEPTEPDGYELWVCLPYQSYRARQDVVYTYDFCLDLYDGCLTSVDGTVRYDNSGIEVLDVVFPELDDEDVVWSVDPERGEIYFNYLNTDGVYLEGRDSVLVSVDFTLFADRGRYGFDTEIRDMSRDDEYVINNYDVWDWCFDRYENVRIAGVPTGDVDGDGEVTILDATRIQRYLAHLCDLYGNEEYSEIYCDDLLCAAADADGDGRVGIFDALRIRRYLVGECELDGTVNAQF